MEPTEPDVGSAEPDMTEMEQGAREFMKSIADETKFVSDACEMQKEELLAVFDTDQKYGVILKAAEKAQDEWIYGAFPRMLSAFMQPPEEAADVEGTILADQLEDQAAEQPRRAGRGQRDH